MFCSRCGQPLDPASKFCGSCGQAVPAPEVEATQIAQPTPAAPVAPQVAPAAEYLPPPMNPLPPMAPAPSGPNPAVAATLSQLSRVLVWDWKGPLKVAGATLGVSLVLTLIFGLVTKPYGPDVHWGFKSMYTWLVWGWESIFGVSAVAGADAKGSFMGVSGSGSAHAGLGAMPLTLTVITLLVAAIVFRRAIRSCTSALSAVLLGLRTALLIAIPLWFFSLFASLSVFDLAKIAGVTTEGTPYTWTDSYDGSVHTERSCNSLCDGLRNLTNAKSSGVDWSASLTTSSLQAFFIVLLLMVAFFAALTLSRAEWFEGRILKPLRLALVAPARGLGVMSIALVLAGLVFAFVTLIVRWTSHAGLAGGYSPSLSTHNWIILIFAFIAYAGNFGVASLGLGSWGEGSATATAHWGGNVPGGDFEPGSITCTIQHGISWWAQGQTTLVTNPCTGFGQDGGSFHASTPSLDWGVWSAAFLAPLVLLYVAWSVTKANGLDPKAKLISLGTWLVSLLAVLPVVAYLAKVSIGGNADGGASGWGSDYSIKADGSASLGLSGATPFIIFGYAIVFALLVALLSGAINANTFSGLSASVAQTKAAQAAQSAGQVPPGYQPPAGAPPAYQPPPFQPPGGQPPPYQPPAYQPPAGGQQPPPYNG